MTSPAITEQHGSRIITALEHAWAAIQDTHPDVPDVVIVTGAGSNQKGTPEGYQLRGHHWPERWVLDGRDAVRAPELFIAGELLAAGGRGGGGDAARGRPRPGRQARHQGHQRAARTCQTRSPAGPTAPCTGRPPTTATPMSWPGLTRPGSRS
jgi:hypothetical protein